ncbi:Plastidal glycolate/glycerate translocator 1, chloroplastic [Seminavis robusta]|uniref:Plastidal glycolate/glycerate translocator 1, chloroplastic n=1 Tax=Seminavis robusta TaxID=568900 RepID=A0A9N8E4L4_9STRA|nr:Plastidal glycolate/glycerate translocator 1, chloroplastic [Seminavis robusta]|eukprot:Sro661_g183210.1 Plastidal glycolate/glycerate translocator 1, chloroplastic (517) ;mRNA; f:34123-35836
MLRCFSLLLGVALLSNAPSLVNAERFSHQPTQHASFPKKVSILTEEVFVNAERVPRGGAKAKVANTKAKAPPAHPDVPTAQQLAGVAVFTIIELSFRKVFKTYNIRFPGQLAGCVALFAVMIAAQAVAPNSGDAICNALSPGAGLLAKWMGVFFVPGLTMLPLAPSVGGPVEILKTLGVVIVGFFYSLALVSYTVLGVRKLLGTLSEEEASSVGSSTTGAAKKPYAESTTKFLVTGSVVTAAISIAATKTGNSFQKPLETLFLGFATLATYVWGANLPSSITTIINPLLSSAILTLGVVRLTAMATDTSFVDVLKSYTCKKLAPMEAGAGDLLLFLLSPSVISFAVGMYKGKALIASNLPAIITAVMTGSIGSMFGTAALARLINLGGSNGKVIRIAAVPRSTQTALGMIIAELLGGDIAIAATMIILTGIFGGMVGVKTLNAWGVKDSVSRGLGIGSAGLSLGVVSIKGEPEAFAFAGLCLVLTAVAATCLASIPAVADLLIKIAGGAPAIAEAL